MKRRILALALALLMTVSILPVEIFANDNSGDIVIVEATPCADCGNVECTCEICGTCGTKNCETDHTPAPEVCSDCGKETCECPVCPTCGVKNCTETHEAAPAPVADVVVCEVCGKETCECPVCPTCGVKNCTETHEAAPADDPAPETCETCGKTPCECVACETCGKIPCECVACEICGKTPCECVACETCGKITCECPPCEVCTKVPCECPVCETCGTKNCTETHKTLTQQLLDAVSLAHFRELFNAEANQAAVQALTKDEINSLIAKVEALYAALEAPQESDTATRDALVAALKALPAMACPECGEFETHAEGCTNIPVKSPEAPATLADKLLETTSVTEFWQMFNADENVTAVWELTVEEIEALQAHVEALYAAISEPTEDDTYYYEDLMSTFPIFLEELEEDPSLLMPNDGYIYFDLAWGSVVIQNNEYTGYLNGTKVTGKHQNSNKYYIFQGDGKTKNYNTVPKYDHVTYDGKTWAKYITNHPHNYGNTLESVNTLITAWDNAQKKGRVGTSNTVEIYPITNGSQFNVTIDNLWSTSESAAFFIESQGTDIPDEKTYNTHQNCATNVVVNLTVKGDNRLSRLHVATRDGQNENYNSDKNHTNTINFNGDADATLTLANIKPNTGKAYTAALIGGTDAEDHSFKMNFNTITVYAGGAEGDFGTAIGGGGNGPGYVTINSGNITAVNSSTGTAIGGGCGTNGPGGYGNVTINGGNVYAYSYNATGFSTYADALPTAIGGGSSGRREGGIGIVKISGGTVYAYSKVGNAIGGGGGGTGLVSNTNGSSSWYHTYGGTANVTISGGSVTAISEQGCAIGGGPGGGKDYDSTTPAKWNCDGGTAKLTISGSPTINSGSIGGGSPLEQNRSSRGATVGAAVVNISGGTISGQVVMAGEIKNIISKDETGLANSQKSSFTMSAGTISNTNHSAFVEDNGGAVYINSGSANIKGGTIMNCSAPLGGAVYVEGGSFTMSGGTIKNVTATQNGGAIYVTAGNVTINGGTIDNGNAEFGGAAYINGGNFLMTSGTINSCRANKDGGAVYVNPPVGGTSSVVFGVQDCGTHTHPVLSNNEAVNGGAIAVSKGAPIMYCGQFTGNKATTNGGAVYVGDGTFTMHNGNMIKNEAVKGGAAYVAGTFTMKNGTVGGTATEDANKATNGGAVYVNGGTFNMENGTFQYNTATDNGGAAYVNNGTFSMTNGIFQNNSAVNGGAVYVNKVTAGTFSMTNGTFQYNNATQGGGAAYVNNGTFTMVDGKFNNNSASQGGAAYVSNGTFTMNGGTMESNTAGNGGAAYVTGENSTMTVKGGKFTTNNATVDGGAAFVSGGRFTIEGGTMNGNTAVNGGAAYVVGAKSSMTVKNGTLSENKATNNGGAAYVSEGTFDFEGGNATKNEAARGGAAYVSNGIFTISGGNMTNNTATDGGAAYVTNGSFNFDGGTMSSNKATNGGAAYVTGSDSSMTVTNGNLSENEASNNGGAAYISGGNFILKSGQITSNTAKENGGAVYISDGHFEMEGGNAANNTAKIGGVAYVTGGNFTMISGTMSNNGHAENTERGGAAYVDGGHIYVGVEHCGGIKNGANHNGTHNGTTIAHTNKTHPVIQTNKAVYGGAFAISGTNDNAGNAVSGIVHIYCGEITQNQANNQSTGHNIYMDGGGVVHCEDSAIIGDTMNHEIVSVGGQLTVERENGDATQITLVYDANATNITVQWQGRAPEGYYINMPFCPSDWENAKGTDFTFVGWSTDPIDTQAPNYADSVRKKGDYFPTGSPKQVKGSNGQMIFYAVWAPKNNTINYAYALLPKAEYEGLEIPYDASAGIIHVNDGLVSFPNVTSYEYRDTYYSLFENVSKPTPDKAGYTFVGWLIYADKNKVSNWNADANPDVPQKLGDMSYKTYWNGQVESNFGDITLVAVFKPAYTNLTITAGPCSAIDENQSFLFRITGTRYDGKEFVPMTVAIKADDQEEKSITIEKIPVGEYTVTPISNWSWRYTSAAGSAPVESAPAVNTEGAYLLVNPAIAYNVTFSNTRNNPYWLSGNSYNK